MSNYARYEVRYWSYGGNYVHGFYADEASALDAAKQLDADLAFGYDGISFIHDTETGKVADVGNGALRDRNNYDAGPYAKAITWVKPKNKSWKKGTV